MSQNTTTEQEAQNVEGLLWPNPPRIEPFYLKDQYGENFGLEQLKEKWSLVFFGFANCPDICPTALQAMTKAVKTLKEDPRNTLPVQAVFVSVDPERDTLKNLKSYANYFSEELIAVTGTPAQLKAMTKSFNTLFMKIDELGDNYSIEHSSGIFFISRSGLMVSVLTPPHNSSQIVKRLTEVSAFIESVNAE